MHPGGSSESLAFEIIPHVDLRGPSDPAIRTVSSTSNPADHRNETVLPLLLDQQYLEDLSRRCEVIHRSLRTKRGSARRLLEPFLPRAFDDRRSFEVAWQEFNEAISRRVFVRSYREQVLNLRDNDASNMLDALQTV
jgi:hypothetical protein